MRTTTLIAASILVLATACSALTGTPTPRPTYTPYPTYTPVPTPTPAELLETEPISPTPTISPEEFGEVGEKEWFSGETAAALGRAKEAFGEGKYQEALEGFLETQRLHGEPSANLQNWIGSSYYALGNREAAIEHFTNALLVEDKPTYRVNRGRQYMATRQCPLAIKDAKAALTMEPQEEEGFHTDVQANDILASCYAQQGEYLLALQHAEATLEIANDNNYSETELETINLTRESIQAVLDGREWPEDLLFEPTLTYFTAGIKLIINGDYEQAITSLKRAQETHNQPSGIIQTWIGHAYSNLGQHEKAIEHHTAAVEIRDTALHRANRAVEYYLLIDQCTEATIDAEAALNMEPYTEPGYHSGAEAHWIMANCLMDSGDEIAALAHMEQAVSIARAHGYSPEEVASMTAIMSDGEASKTAPPPTGIAPATPEPPAPRDEPAAGKPESLDVDEKTGLITLTDLRAAKWLQQTHPDAARKLAKLPWIADGADPGEEKILELLILIISRGIQTNVLDPTGKSLRPEDALLMMDMPFLQSIEPGDLPAVRTMSRIVQDDSAQFSAILRHPTFTGGITDEWTPIIATLSGAHKYNPSLIQTLLDHERVSLESRTVDLPHTGPVELHIVRIGDAGNPGTMDILENAVIDTEFFMALPLPVQMVSVLFADSVTPSYTGNNFGTSIAILTEHENNEHLPETFAHEVAHYYWSGSQDWIDEGMADLIESYHRWQRTGIPMTASRYPCQHFDNIQQLEMAKPSTSQKEFTCNYSLGERLFLALWTELGDVPFREGAQRLYEKSQAGKAGVEEVRTAFNRPNTTNQWYSNTGTAQGIDGSEPSWKLDEIHGTIDEASIALSNGGPKVESFSARSHLGNAHFRFHYNHPPFTEKSWTVNLTMVEIFEDGIIYEMRPLELKVQGKHTGGTWHLSVGPGPAERWKPGAHHVILYDRDSTKVAHTTWTVTP